MSNTKSPAIGIDLGTTYSGAAVYCDNWLRMITDEHSNVIIPSLVAYDDKQILVGDEVRYQMSNNPQNSIFEAKRFIGRDFNDPSIKEGKDLNRWPFTIKEHNNRIQIMVNFNGEEKLLLPEEISATVLKKLKDNADKYFGQPITDVVVSVPAYFNDNQRNATKTAATIAGLNPIRIINEPTAEALAFGFGRSELENEKHILVYDLGGGTFDVSILNITRRNFLVRASTGDSSLGGEDFTNRLRNHILKEFANKHKIKADKDKRAVSRLKESCERAKRRLSQRDCKEVDIHVDKFCSNSSGTHIDLTIKITRSLFEQLNKDLFDRTIQMVKSCLKEAKLISSLIDEVIMVGGSTRIPKIQELLEKEFTPQKVNRTVNPDEAVALGTAVEAAILSGSECPKIKDTILLDITPLSLGVGVVGDEMSTVVKKNSIIPNKKTQGYQTAHDYQTSIRYSIYQGERACVKDNFYLGEFTLTGIQKARKGDVKTDVTFDLDSDGMLTVTAIENKTGNSKSISIEKSVGRHSKQEVDNMIQTAKLLEAVDRKFRRKASKKRELDQYTYDVENFLILNTSRTKLTPQAYRECKEKNDAALDFLSFKKNAEEFEYQDWLDDLGDVCGPSLGDIFEREKGRKIGESISTNVSSSSTSKAYNKYDVD